MAFGFDELVSAGATALGFPDPFGAAGGGVPGTSIEISQEEGDPARRLRVVLRGRAMPFELVEFGVAQRTKVTRYPGNPVATQQVLGPEELPTQMSGAWSNRYLTGAITVNGDDKRVTTVREAVELFGSLCRSGKRVRVQWGSEIRTGLLKSFTPRWQREQDATWEVEWEWSSRNDETTARGASGLDAGVSTDLFAYLNRVEDIAALVPLAAELAASAVAQVVDTINRVRDVVSDVVQVLRIAETVVSVPSTVFGAAKAAVTSLELETSELVRQLTTSRAGTSSSAGAALTGDTTSPLYTSSGAALNSSSSTQQLQFEVWRRSTARAAENLLYATQQQVAALTRRVQPQTVQTYTAKGDQDLYAISRQFYGAPDFANFLAVANRLSSVRVKAGTQLRIPPRPLGASARVDLVHSPKLSCDARCSC
jgi:LysM repeat protein